MGLLGGGGVHAIDSHLYALIDMAERLAVPRIALHLLTDGRDTLPRSALGYLRKLLDYAHGRAQVASIGGRYYGMDRDKRWQRTELFYRAAVDGTGPSNSDPIAAVQHAYDSGVTDEFMLPVAITHDGIPVAPVHVYQVYQRVVATDHGAVMLWADSRLPALMKVYAQRFDRQGHPAWTTNGAVGGNFSTGIANVLAGVHGSS